MGKESTNLGDSGQIVGHHGQRRPQRPLRKLAVLLERVPATALGRVLEGKQRPCIRIIPALPQDMWVVPPVGFGSHPREG